MRDNSTRRHTRLAAAAVLALGLVSTTPAAADPGGNGNGQANGHATAPGQTGQAPAAQPAPQPAPQAAQGQNAAASKGSNGKSAQAKPAKPAKPAKAAKPAKPAKPAPAKAAKPAPAKPAPAKPAPATSAPSKPAKTAKPAKAAKPADPMGNNGTVKIAPYGEMDGIPNNTPHVGCTFQVEWYGFDEGDDIISTVSFAEHAPTLDAGMSVSGPSTVDVGGDPATGAGTDTGLDGVAVYTLSFTGEPHPKQGFHVKLTINTPRSHGNDSKTKVFWVEGCTTTTPPVTNPPTSTPEVPETEDTDSTPEVPVTEDTDSTPEVLGAEGSDSTPQAQGDETTDSTSEVLGEEAAESAAAEDNAAAADTEVLGAQATRSQNTGAQLPTAVAAGADALGLETTAERSLFGLLLMLLGAAVGGFAWTRRGRA